MQLPGIIAFLLLLQYEVSSRHNGRFGDELELLQNSLVERIYEDTALNPEDDDDEIEEIANAILEEAERRLKKRELSRKHDTDEDAKQEYKADGTKSRSDSHVEQPKSYKDAVSDAYKDVVKRFNTDTAKEKDERKNKREVSDDQIKQNKKLYKKQISKYKKSIKLNTKLKRSPADQVEVSHTDNNQIATVKVDNTPDKQARLANNPQAGKKLFLETDTEDNKVKNKSQSYAGRDHKTPPQRVVTNKIDRSGLDQFSFIAIIVGCCVAGVAGIGLVSFCWYKLRTETKDIKNGSPNGSFKSNSFRGSDRKKKTSDEDKLTQGAEVFHYLHAKKQMQQMEEPIMKSDHCSINESSDDEEEDEENTVYECPGLAPPGDMKVVNPLFSDSESHYSDPPSLHSTPTPPLEEK